MNWNAVRLVFVWCIVAFAAAPAFSQLIIDIPNVTITEGTATAAVDVLVSGTDTLDAISLGFGVGDGGPVLAGTDIVPIIGPTVASFTGAGTIFAGQTLAVSNSPSLPASSATVTDVSSLSGSVIGNGLLMSYVLDTSSLSAGDMFTLDANIGASSGVPTTVTDSGGTVNRALIFNTGMLSVTPRPISSLQIDIPDVTITEGTATATVDVLISGTDTLDAISLGFGVGDGGPVLAGTDIVPIIGPTAASFTGAGTIFAGQTLAVSNSPSLPASSATVTDISSLSGSVVGNGLLVSYLLDTSSLSAGDMFTLDANIGASSGVPTTVTDAGGTINHGVVFDSGTLSVVPVPEPASLPMLTLACLLFIVRGRSQRAK